MNNRSDYLEIAERLQLALRVALINGKFDEDVKQYLERIDREAEEILGKIGHSIKSTGRGL